ncbi:MAG: MATE family efflux transporter [Clostridium sp.]
MKKNQLKTNLLANILAFIINMGTSFLLTPFIVARLGNEAYGYIGLANNFISCANLFTIAINSMAGRFIGIEIYNKRYKKANIYYSSVLGANLFIITIISLISVYIITNISSLINVSEYLLRDLQITLIILSLNFAISALVSIYNVASFVKNRLDLQSLGQIGSYIIRAVVMILLFVMLPTKIYYMAIATVLATIFLFIVNYFITKKLLPDIKIDIKKFKLFAVKELVFSGMWNSLNSLSNILLTGLDLLIANLFIGSEMMGVLSIAKTIPNAVRLLTGTIAQTFVPNYLKSYSKGDNSEILYEANLSIKILAFLMIVPMAGFMAFGTDFYNLWLPNKTAKEIEIIQILSVLTILPTIFNAFIEGLYGINQVTNRVKTSVLVTIVISILSMVVVFILLKFTSLGVYAIAGVSSVFISFRVLFFAPMYAAYVLNEKLTTFYPPLLKCIFCLVVTTIIFNIINSIFNINTVIDFIFIVIVAGVVGYIVNFYIILDRRERESVIKSILRRYGIKKNIL